MKKARVALDHASFFCSDPNEVDAYQFTRSTASPTPSK